MKRLAIGMVLLLALAACVPTLLANDGRVTVGVSTPRGRVAGGSRLG